MANWQQLVVMFQAASGLGFQYGKVVYPTGLKDQDINAVIDQYGKQGFEVLSLRMEGNLASVVLKKPVS